MAGLRKIIDKIPLASVAAATCLFFATTCLAADTSVASSMPLKAPPIANYDWSGFYVGGHVGYGRGNGSNTLSNPNPSSASSSFGSLFGGLQFGYNYLLSSRLLAGIEGDISFPNYLDDGIVASRSAPSSAVTEKLDFVSTLRGRAGYAFDHWLFYATGGLAWSQARFLEESSSTGNQDKVLRMRSGWVLGVGAELAIAPGWTARLEYLYDRLGKASGTFHRAPVTNRRRWNSIVFESDSTGSLIGPERLQTAATPAAHGQSTPAAGMSTGSLPSSSRAIPLSDRPMKVRIA